MTYPLCLALLALLGFGSATDLSSAATVSGYGPGGCARLDNRSTERLLGVAADPAGLRWADGQGVLAASLLLLVIVGGSTRLRSQRQRVEGNIHLDSDRLEPSTQRALPPQSSRSFPATVPSHESHSGGVRERPLILLVDNDIAARRSLRCQLEPAYRITEAAGGSEALIKALASTPDLVVTDFGKPGLNFDLLSSLRLDERLAVVPVVVVTHSASQESRLESLRRGVDDYLVQPVDPRELLARISNLLATQQRLLERFRAQASAPSARGIEISQIEAMPADQIFVERVVAEIEKQLGNSDHTVEMLAESLGCDRSHLLRKLKAIAGQTPSSLIRSLRLQRATQLLQADAANVSEIAFAVGFKTAAHFSRTFSRRYGESPSAYARRHREAEVRRESVGGKPGRLGTAHELGDAPRPDTSPRSQ